MSMGLSARAFCYLAVLSVVLPGAAACSAAAEGPEQLQAVVQARYDFDPGSFTQGLEVAEDGTLYVGTGQEGESRVYRRTVEGDELVSAGLDPEYFGEGITRAGEHLWQLTWRNGVAIQRDAETLEETGRAGIDGEGWGLCARQDELIYSDGTSYLRRMDPETMQERERFEVTLEGSPVSGINELECVGGAVYANVFLTTDILRIDADSGAVTAVIDASGLENNAAPDPNNVLNGIAHIPGTDEFYLAGKRWPDLYRVSFEPAG
ncbi:Glutamine cyclotransferase [Corynebacterium auris]|nr:Glutamine cyclotransferase [Corynebacterium auris]